VLTAGFLFWCWDFINRRASAGVVLAAVKKRGKLADIDGRKRPSILVNKKGARSHAPYTKDNFYRSVSYCAG